MKENNIGKINLGVIIFGGIFVLSFILSYVSSNFGLGQLSNNPFLMIWFMFGIFISPFLAIISLFFSKSKEPEELLLKPVPTKKKIIKIILVIVILVFIFWFFDSLLSGLNDLSKFLGGALT